MAPNLLSGGQQTVASAGATLDLFEQHFISLSRLHLIRRNRDIAINIVTSFFLLNLSLIIRKKNEFHNAETETTKFLFRCSRNGGAFERESKQNIYYINETILKKIFVSKIFYLKNRLEQLHIPTTLRSLVPASILEFRPATGRHIVIPGQGLLVPVHQRGPGVTSRPGESLGARTTRQTPHARATLAATTQGPLPARKKPVRCTFANAVRRCQHPAIEKGRPRPRCC